jgi:hypothetical protein
MTEGRQLYADMMTGCLLLRHPDNPTLAILRLDTKRDTRWVMATRQALLRLAWECEKYADKMRYANSSAIAANFAKLPKLSHKPRHGRFRSFGVCVARFYEQFQCKAA